MADGTTARAAADTSPGPIIVPGPGPGGGGLQAYGERALLYGTYAFRLHGDDMSAGLFNTVSAIGTISFDGQGNVTGFGMRMTRGSTPQTEPGFDSGSYSVNDGIGSVEVTAMGSTPSRWTFDIAINDGGKGFYLSLEKFEVNVSGYFSSYANYTLSGEATAQ
jgi:hypothetical protein